MSIKHEKKRGGKSRRRWWKQGMALLSAALLAGSAGILSPVMAEDEAAQEGSGDSAMGRYLEEDLALPEGCMNIQDIKVLDDGTLRTIYIKEDSILYPVCYADSADGGESWGQPVFLNDLLGLDSETWSLDFCGLASDGGIFAYAVRSAGEDNEERESCYYYIDSEGNVQAWNLGDLGEYCYQPQATGRGTVLLNVMSNGLAEVSLEDGSVVARYEEGSSVDYYALAGETILLCSQGKLLCYDLESGDPVEMPEPLNDDISANESNLYIQGVGFYPVVFAPGAENDGIFYADSRGIYHYAFGGSVVEQIIDGSLNSISSPSMTYVKLETDQEGRFYLAAIDYERSPSARILRYEYSADTPTVPDTELKIYSLTDNDLIRQAAALFQKKYPDIYISLETGMTGEDAVTTADALRTLNTEIMADKGPDILMMDGIPADSYIEEGLLLDISGILSEVDEEEGLLPNIYNAYIREDGSVYEMPVKFAIPMIQGHREDLEKIVDLKTLADVVEEHEGEYNYKSMPSAYCYGPRLLLKGLAGTSSVLWVKEDGTLDEEAVGEYLTQCGRIYQSSEQAREEMKESVGDYFDQVVYEMESGIVTTDISSFSLSLLTKTDLVGIGGLSSCANLPMVYSAELFDSSLTSKVWDGQAKNVFFPRQMIGISAKTREQEAAELFVKFLFSSEGQTVGSSLGLPVNSAVYNSAQCWEEGSPEDVTGVVSSYDKETDTDVEMDVHNPSGERIEEVKALGTSLTVPAASNDVILSAVTDAGSRYLEGELSLEDALKEISREVNLYMSE